jgi:DHA1 family multidrug resistance protein-like MFS transporter
VIFFIIIMAGTMIAPIFPLFIEQLVAGATRVASTTGYLIAVTNLVGAVFSVWVGKLSDRMNRGKLLTACTLGTGVLFLLQALVRNVAEMFALRGLVGVTAGPTGPTINSLISDKVPQDGLGRAFGLTHAVSSAGLTLGPLVGGYLAAHLGYRWPFAVTGIVLMGIALLAHYRVRDVRPAEETPGGEPETQEELVDSPAEPESVAAGVASESRN